MKVKTSDPAAAPEIGLVPASYIAPVAAVRATQALYDYVPARDDGTGELENEEEMEIVEGEQLEILEDEGEWILCRKLDGTKAVGFVPANYLDGDDDGNGDEEQGYDVSFGLSRSPLRSRMSSMRRRRILQLPPLLMSVRLSAAQARVQSPAISKLSVSP